MQGRPLLKQPGNQARGVHPTPSSDTHQMPRKGGIALGVPETAGCCGKRAQLTGSQPPSVPSSVFVFTSYRGLSDDHPPAGAWRGHTFHFWTPRAPWLSPQGAAEKADSQGVHGIRATERGAEDPGIHGTCGDSVSHLEWPFYHTSSVPRGTVEKSDVSRV